MLLLLLAACTDKPADDTAADTDLPPDPDVADLPAGIGFYLRGTVQDAPFELGCGPTATAGYARAEGTVQLTAGCQDTSTADGPNAVLTISGETAATYSDCSYSPGDALLQVGVDGAFVSCALDGAQAFDVFVDLVEPAGDELRYTGTLLWRTEDRSTNLVGRFDVTGACTSGC